MSNTIYEADGIQVDLFAGAVNLDGKGRRRVQITDTTTGNYVEMGVSTWSKLITTMWCTVFNQG